MQISLNPHVRLSLSAISCLGEQQQQQLRIHTWSKGMQQRGSNRYQMSLVVEVRIFSLFLSQSFPPSTFSKKNSPASVCLCQIFLPFFRRVIPIICSGDSQHLLVGKFRVGIKRALVKPENRLLQRRRIEEEHTIIL